MVKGAMKILAFFGAFNPPTKAHIELAEQAMKAADFEAVMFFPSKAEYITGSQGKDYAFEDSYRMDMLMDLSASRPWMMVSGHDMECDIQPRTYDSLCALRDQGFQPSLLIGGDVLKKLEKEWLNVDKIAKEFGFVCLQRENEDLRVLVHDDPFLSQFESSICFVQTETGYHGVSSTSVRRSFDNALISWQEVCALVPPEVSALLLKSFFDCIIGEKHEV